MPSAASFAPLLADGLVDLPRDPLRALGELLVEFEQDDLGDEHLERGLVERTVQNAVQPRLSSVDITVEGVRIQDDEHGPIMPRLPIEISSRLPG